jgi:hypothetical protein
MLYYNTSCEFPNGMKQLYSSVLKKGYKIITIHTTERFFNKYGVETVCVGIVRNIPYDFDVIAWKTDPYKDDFLSFAGPAFMTEHRQ